MFPVIKESSYYQGKIFGLPLSANFEALYYNRELVEKHNIDLGSIRSWDDYLELAEKIHKDNRMPGYEIIENKNAIYRIMLEQYVLNYNDIYSGKVNFNTNEFKKVLETMKRINESESIKHRIGIPDTNINDKLFIISSCAFFRNFKEDVYFMSLPNIDDNRNQVSALGVQWAIINPNSKNKELAIRYLEAMVGDGEEGYPYYSREVIFNDKSLYDGISDVYFENYEKVIGKTSAKMEIVNIFGNANPILGLYFNGAITVDEAAEQIHEKVAMMLTE